MVSPGIEKLYTLPQVAEVLELGRSSVRKLIRRRDLRIVKMGSGPNAAVRVTAEDLRDFIAQRQAATDEQARA